MLRFEVCLGFSRDQMITERGTGKTFTAANLIVTVVVKRYELRMGVEGPV